MFQQQRFGFCVSNRYINLLDLGDQRFGFARSEVAKEIAGKPFFQVFRFADIDNRTTSIVHAINAWLAGYGF